MNTQAHDNIKFLYTTCTYNNYTCTMYMYIHCTSLKSLPVQSILQVPIQKLQALNGKEMEIPVRSVLHHLRAKVLQLQLANTAPEFVYTCT